MNNYSEKIEEAWQHGLQILQPTDIEMQKGLELHRELAVCENYGFLPKIYSPELKSEIEKLNDRHLAWPEWKLKSRTLRVTSPTQSAESVREFSDVLDHTGISAMIQSVNYMGESLDEAVMIMAAYRRLCVTLKDRVFQATGADDIDEAKKTGRTGIFFSLTSLPVSGAGSLRDLDGLLDWVQVWHNMGVRFMHLGYNRRNCFADGCMEEHDGGLSDLGRELVLRMNCVGIVVDVPHSSVKTTLHAAAVSKKPIMASHVGCASINEHPRCKTDAELKAIADTGGYSGIVSMPSFLGPNANINLLLQHVQHAIETVGADHVAIGTDLGYGQDWPKDIPGNKPARKINPLGNAPKPVGPVPQDPLGNASLAWTNWPLLTVGLVKMGLSDSDIEKVLGGNLRRILRDCSSGN